MTVCSMFSLLYVTIVHLCIKIQKTKTYKQTYGYITSIKCKVFSYNAGKSESY